PRLAHALARGELSDAKVRALTRVATPETEERLLKVGKAGTAEHVERIVRGWRRVDRIAEARDTARRHKSRALHIYKDEDGMVIIRGRLAPEVGAVVMKALEAARDALDQRSSNVSAETSVPEVTPAVAHQPADARAASRRRYVARLTRAPEAVASRAVACDSVRATTFATGRTAAPTTLSNLALLCRRHHRAVHEEGYQVDRDADGTLSFRRPDGQLLPAVPPPAPVPAQPVEVLRARHNAQGLHIHARTSICRAG